MYKRQGPQRTPPAPATWATIGGFGHFLGHFFSETETFNRVNTTLFLCGLKLFMRCGSPDVHRHVMKGLFWIYVGCATNKMFSSPFFSFFRVRCRSTGPCGPKVVGGESTGGPPDTTVASVLRRKTSCYTHSPCIVSFSMLLICSPGVLFCFLCCLFACVLRF